MGGGGGEGNDGVPRLPHAACMGGGGGNDGVPCLPHADCRGGVKI